MPQDAPAAATPNGDVPSELPEPAATDTPTPDVVEGDDPPITTTEMEEDLASGEVSRNIDAFLSQDDDDLDEPSEEEPAAPTPEKPAEEPTEKPAPVEATPPATPEVPPTVAPVVEPAPVTPPEPEVPAETPAAAAPSAPAITAEELEAQHVEMRSAAETRLAKDHYGFSEEQATEAGIDEATAKAIARASSRVYMDAVEGTMRQVLQNFPRLVEAAMTHRTASGKASEDFYGSWPALAKGDAIHDTTIQRIGQTYRERNPRATTEEFIRDVGAMSVVALKLPVTPAAPETPPDPPAVASFTPAATTTPAAPNSGTPNNNVWGDLADEETDAEFLDADR